MHKNAEGVLTRITRRVGSSVAYELTKRGIISVNKLGKCSSSHTESKAGDGVSGIWSFGVLEFWGFGAWRTGSRTGFEKHANTHGLDYLTSRRASSML